MRVRADDPDTADVRVFVDGEDVTELCNSADSDEGWAWVYRTNSDGQRYVVCANCQRALTSRQRELGHCGACGHTELMPALEKRVGTIRIERVRIER